MADADPKLPKQPPHEGQETGMATVPSASASDWLEQLIQQQANRWQAGEKVLVEVLIAQEPLLRLDHAAQIHLITLERNFRRDRGESAELAEYLSRFPALERELRALFSESTDSPTLTFGVARPENTLARAEDTRPDSKFRSGKVGKRSGSAMSLQLLAAAEQAGYEILEELGRGGMGVVYKARHKSLKRLVAIKTLSTSMQSDEEQVDRFRKEAMAIAKLQHPNIVAVYDVGEFLDVPYLALEYVDGGSLADLLMRARQSPLQAAMLVEPLARAVHLAHGQNILHRDLKPANVLLAKDGTPKISDFGLAKQMDESTGWTRTGDIMGTPCYMAPEQAEGRIKQLGPATDVYALGTILYETVTGQPPFRGGSSLETLEMVRTHEPEPLRKWLPAVPRDLETIVLKCMEKEPAQRYASAAALADDLQRFIQDEPIIAKRATTKIRLARWWKKNQIVAALFLMIFVLGALLLQQVASYFLRKDKQASVQVQPTADLGVPRQETNPITGTRPDEITLPAPTQPTATPAPNETTVAATDVPSKPTPPLPPPPPATPKTIDDFLAAAREAQGTHDALKAYAAAWQLARTSPAREQVRRYRQILEPALVLAAKLSEDTPSEDRALAARLFAAKGRLLRDFPYEPWGLQESVYRVSADAYAEAIRLHPHTVKPDRALAEYHTGRGLALTRIEGVRIGEVENQLLAAAEAATAAAPEYAGGWNLKGFVHFHRAFELYGKEVLELEFLAGAPPKYGHQQVDAAIQAYDQAVIKARESQPPDDNTAIYLTNRSAAHLLLGSMQEEKPAREQAWNKAVADAEAALELAPEYDLALQALGLAYESLAWKPLQIGREDGFAKARDSFSAQVRLRASSAEAQANLGRCLAKWAMEEEGAASEHAVAAKAALEEALRYDSKLGDAWFWQGRLAVHTHDAEAAQVAWREAARTPAAARVLWQLRPILVDQPEQFTELLELALAHARETAKDMEAPQLFPLLLLSAKWRADHSPEDLQREEPQALTDAILADKLAQVPLDSALALLAKAHVCHAIVHAKNVQVETRLLRLVDFCGAAEGYLELRPDSPGALPLLRQLTNSLEALGKDSRREKKDRIDFLRRAAVHAERGAELSSGPDRSSWLRRRQDLQRDLNRLTDDG